ncbi:TPA: hypothetical protein UM684_000726 [Stenotrophomonas maltophilia]|nr:hypothetical protein [Stenotrophomonas maltophilia]HEL3858846.1 hypothetical protein [Stenotrophomonas maltophilia]
MEQNENAMTAIAAQLQVLDEVVSALVTAHPEPGRLLSEIEQSLARLKSVAGTRGAMETPTPSQAAYVLKVHQKTDLWLDFARAHLR